MHSQRGITLVDKKTHTNTCKVGKADESICTYVTRQLFSYSLTAKKKEGIMCRFVINWAMYDIQMEGLKTNAQIYQEPSTRAPRQLP
jgi:hypothetical protein